MFFDDLGWPLAIGLAIASVLIIVALLLGLYRLAKGPDVFDRVMAFELVSGTCLCAIVLFAIHFDQPVMLEVAFALAVIGFLGAVAFARYLENGGCE